MSDSDPTAEVVRVDLGTGMPNPCLIPTVQLLSVALEHARTSSASDTDAWMNYGPSEGSAAFRASLAEFLSNSYGELTIEGVRVLPDALFATNGSSHGLALVMRLLAAQWAALASPGTAAFPACKRATEFRIGVEEHCYWFALSTLRQVPNATLVPLELDCEGVTVPALDGALPLDAVYIIPTGQNPTGRTLSNTRRNAVLLHAARHAYIVVTDDVYESLTFPEEIDRLAPCGALPLVCLVDAQFREVSPAIDHHVLVNSFTAVSLGSFSKLVAPSLRCGWLQFPVTHSRKWVRYLGEDGVVLSGGGYSHFVSEAIRFGLAGVDAWVPRHVATVRCELAHRCRSLCDSLSVEIERRGSPHPLSVWRGVTTPQDPLFCKPTAGYFVWLRVPCAAATLVAAAATAGVIVKDGSLFDPIVISQTRKHFIRLCFAYADKSMFREGARQLFRAIDEVMSWPRV